LSGVACYLSIVAKMLNCTWDEALHVPVVLGNHAIALKYAENDVEFHFPNAQPMMKI